MAENDGINRQFGYLPLADPEFLRIAEALERISTAVGADVTALAIQKAAEAAASALVAEGFAVGEQNGTAVTSGPYFQYNSKYFADSCANTIDGKVSEMQDVIDLANETIDNLQNESGYAWFNVNNSDGEMYVTVVSSVDKNTRFAVNTTTGELMVTVTVVTE